MTDAELPRGGSRGQRGPYAKSAVRREQILDAAVDTFAAVGYVGGSLRAVAERAGIAETTVLHHFASKQALLIGLLERREQHSKVGISDSSDVIDALTSLLAEDDQNDTVFTELFARLVAEAIEPQHPAHQYFVERYARVRRELTGALADIARQDRLPVGVTPASAATLVLAVWDGLQTQWLLDRDALDVRAELRTFLERMLFCAPRQSQSPKERTI